jgi:hypothetical protein
MRSSSSACCRRLLFAKVCTGLEIDFLFSLCVPLLRFVGGVAYAKKGLIGLWFVWLTNIICLQKECSSGFWLFWEIWTAIPSSRRVGFCVRSFV